MSLQWPDYRNRILAEIDNEAFFLSVLKNVSRRGSEIKAECPFVHLHEDGKDATPSLTVNVAKGVYICQTCRTKGNAHTLFKVLNNLTSEQAWFALGDELKIPRPDSTKPTRPDIDPGLISHYHKKLMELTGPLRKVLVEKRGYTNETLRRFQLGWDGDRITIPIYDEYNQLVNFRRYKWNSTEDKWKVINYEDEIGNTYGEVRIFGIDNLLNDDITEIVWCEGETDRILSEQYGFPASCPTSGAGSWRNEWTVFFRSKKKVYVVQDNDEAGRNATQKICEKLHRVVDVYIIQWPEDFPVKGDITDFFVKCGFSAEDFRRLLDSAVKYENHEIERVDEMDAVNVHLAESGNASLHSKRIKTQVMISGKDGTPYLCPRKIKFSCGSFADTEKKKCSNCELALYAGERIIELSAANKDVMKLIKCTEDRQIAVMKEIGGVEKNCKQVSITAVEYMNIEEIRLIPRADVGFGFSKEHEYVVRSGYYIGDNLKTNKRYTLIGYMHSDPMTQYANYMFDKAIPEKDFISEFELSEEVVEQLRVFQLKQGQTVLDKFNEVHVDLERNVTRVWERRDVAFAVDLIYHTALNFYFQEQFIKRGWGELLIIGDSGQAKSTIVESLMQHYRLGEMHSGESSRRTGLVYSLQQTNKRWFLVWGAFPLNDGGLLAIDELSGISEDDLAVMSDVRSSGIAKSTGVITAETSARTRAIYISNPRNGRPLNTETHGVSAVLKLFGKTEDVRRLDLAMSVASGDVDPTLINRKLSDMPDVPHRYTSDLCNLRVMWAWSRTPDNIVFKQEAVDYILNKATEMGRMYSSSVPIVEAADQRIKLARLAAACAACVCSTDEKFEQIIVGKEHVDFVVDFMHKVYSAKSFAYDKLSERDTTNNDTSTDRIKQLRNRFAILPLPDHNEMVRILYNLPYFSRSTLEDYTGLPKDELRVMLKFLTTEALVEKVRMDYRRFPLGTEFLTHVLETPFTVQEINETRKRVYGDPEF